MAQALAIENRRSFEDGAPALDKGDIHCWMIPLDQVAGAAALLDDHEQDRARRFRFDRDRRRFVAGHTAIRRLLGGYLDLAPERIMFDIDADGRPALAHETEVNFSYSRSGSWGFLAVARAQWLGADLEKIAAEDDLTGVAADNFSPAERRALAGLAPGQWLDGFYACWTRKEAVVKAAGRGLLMPLELFDVSLSPGEEGKILRAEGEASPALSWKLNGFKPLEDYWAAIVADLPAPVLRHYWIEPLAAA